MFFCTGISDDYYRDIAKKAPGQKPGVIVRSGPFSSWSVLGDDGWEQKNKELSNMWDDSVAKYEANLKKIQDSDDHNNLVKNLEFHPSDDNDDDEWDKIMANDAEYQKQFDEFMKEQQLATEEFKEKSQLTEDKMKKWNPWR